MAASSTPEAHLSGRFVDLGAPLVEALQRAGDDGQVVTQAGMDLDDPASDPALQLCRRAGGHGSAVVDDDDVARQLVGLVQVLSSQQHVGATADQGPG